MTGAELLIVTKRPNGWSKSAYYRLRSVCARIKKEIPETVDVTEANLEQFLKSIRIKVRARKTHVYSRTHKTYITELKRYFKYLNKLKNEIK
jgi:hypothetical protein